MDKKFVHLHVHTEYSLLDGFSKVANLIKRTKELNMKSVAITDHGNMFGVIDFYKTAKKEGIKPIIGCELYVAPRKLSDKDPNKDKYAGHLVLLAKNIEGYKNLIKLVSISYTKGFYYKPRVGFEELEKYNEGLIATSACLSGLVARSLLNDDYKKAKSYALRYRDIFGKDNFYLEIQDQKLEKQKINSEIIRLSMETGIPLVATNDVHYVRKEDSKIHDILMCIQMGKTYNDPDRMRFGSDEFYLKSREEMEEVFSYVSEALDNTVEIADRCNVDFDFNTIHLPKYDLPEGQRPNNYLRELCYKGLYERYENPGKDIIDRLNFELDVIEKMGYVEYFLIVWDFINFSKTNNIVVGPGRGSAAGSIVSYTLKITDIDPIKYSLLFERFLNPERVSMPDIDIDFCYERREDVIDYVKKKYGEDHVAQIITFGTMGAKAAIRDVGRVLDIPYSKVDKIAKEIPFALGMTIDKALDTNSTLETMYEEDPETKEIINISKQLEGMLRHASTHAAGVVISNKAIDEYVPLYKHQDSISTQFTMSTLEELGLLKMDFLGLRTLTVINDTLELIEKNRKTKGYTEKINFSKMDYDNPKVYELLTSGNTLGIFQLESAGMRSFMKQLRPSQFEDIVAGISLYRPGPMDSIPKYIEGKNNQENIQYTHEKLKPILEVTYGCLVYQEQVMQVVRDLGGYSYSRSDLVRRAMSKKKMDVMEEERQYFIHGKYDDEGNLEIKGCIRNGVPEDIANEIFDDMIDFANYAFNKSHAAAYGVLAYETAYLKTYYPVEFMAALITSVMGNTDKVVEYIKECKELNIGVLPPNINKSFAKFSVECESIRFGLAAVKNVGVNIINNIVGEREKNGQYKDFISFLKRLNPKDTNKRVIESLIKCGAFDDITSSRASLMTGYEPVLDSLSMDRKKNIRGQISLFEVFGCESENGVFEEMHNLPEVREYDEKVKLNFEKEVLGMYVSGHPLSGYEEELSKKTTIDNSKLNVIREDGESYLKMNESNVIMGGIVIKKSIKATKKNDMMAFVELEDLYGTIEVVVFPQLLKKYNDIIHEDAIIYVRGNLSISEGEDAKLIAKEIINVSDEYEFQKDGYGVSKFNNYSESIKGKKIYIKIDSLKNDDLTESISKIASKFKGNDCIYLYPEDENINNNKVAYKMASVSTCANNGLIENLSKILPSDNIKII